MKFRNRLLALFLALLLPVAALAESIDLSGLTNDQLVELKSRIVAELEARNPVEITELHFRDGGPWMLVNADGLTVYFTGRRRHDMPFYYLETVFENNSDRELSVWAENYKLNGWNLSGGLICPSIKPGEKQASSLMFDINDALLTSFNEMKELTFTVETKGTDYSTVRNYGDFTMFFNEGD